MRSCRVRGREGLKRTTVHHVLKLQLFGTSSEMFSVPAGTSIVITVSSKRGVAVRALVEKDVVWASAENCTTGDGCTGGLYMPRLASLSIEAETRYYREQTNVTVDMTFEKYIIPDDARCRAGHYVYHDVGPDDIIIIEDREHRSFDGEIYYPNKVRSNKNVVGFVLLVTLPIAVSAAVLVPLFAIGFSMDNNPNM